MVLLLRDLRSFSSMMTTTTMMTTADDDNDDDIVHSSFVFQTSSSLPPISFLRSLRAWLSELPSVAQPFN